MEFGFKFALDDRHHGRRRREGAAGIGKDRHFKRRHHGFARTAHHVNSHLGIASADEDAGPLQSSRAPRKNRVLYQRLDFARLDMQVGNRRIPASIQRHIDVKRAQILFRCQHVEDVRLFHGDLFGCSS